MKEYGWIFVGPTPGLESGESLATVRRNWLPLKNCLLRGEGIVLYYEKPSGRDTQKVTVQLFPFGPEGEWGSFSVSHPLPREGRILSLQERPFDGFLRYFEFDTVSRYRRHGENLSWKLGIVRFQEPSND